MTMTRTDKDLERENNTVSSTSHLPEFISLRKINNIDLNTPLAAGR